MSPGPIYDPIENLEKLVEPAYDLVSGIGIGKGDIALNTFTYHLVPASWAIDILLRKVGVTVIPSGTGNTDLQVQIMRELKVNIFCGTPSFLATVIKRAEDSGYKFKEDFNLRIAFCAAEPLPESLRRNFQEVYGINVFNLLGVTDVLVVGCECQEKRGFHIPDNLIFEIVDPETRKELGPGEVGEAVVTNLLSKAYPLLRFGTGDLSSYTDEPCPCGQKTRRLMGILGRVGEATKVRGMFLQPKQLEEAVSKYPQVSKFQAVVSRPAQRDELVLRVELPSEEIDKEQLSESLSKSLQDVCRVKIDKIEFVAQGEIAPGEKLIADKRTWK
jgi:phenylacetate-CoA ligase